VRAYVGGIANAVQRGSGSPPTGALSRSGTRGRRSGHGGGNFWDEPPKVGATRLDLPKTVRYRPRASRVAP
jgi:hypothetical protein